MVQKERKEKVTGISPLVAVKSQTDSSTDKGEGSLGKIVFLPFLGCPLLGRLELVPHMLQFVFVFVFVTICISHIPWQPPLLERLELVLEPNMLRFVAQYLSATCLYPSGGDKDASEKCKQMLQQSITDL